MFQCFLDESGNAPDQQMIVMGGLVADVLNWIKFTAQWEAARKRAPGAEFVKYSELVRGEGQFSAERGWTDDLRLDRIIEFAGIIKEHCIGFTYTAIRHEHFEKHVQKIPLHHRNLLSDSPYPQVALKSLTGVMDLLFQHGLTQTCDFYYDTAVGPDILIHAMWPSLRSLPQEIPPEISMGRPLPTFGNVAFRSELELEPLQAADVIAGMMRDVLMTGKTHRGLKPLEKLFHTGIVLDEEEVLLTAAMLQDRIDEVVKVNPGIKLYGYDKKTAARLRKRLERERRDPRPDKRKPSADPLDEPEN